MRHRRNWWWIVRILAERVKTTKEGLQQHHSNTAGTVEAMETASKHFSEAEEITLCRAWVTISEDPVTSTNQTSTTFWDRIAMEFQEKSGTIRSAKSLQSKWGRISRETSKFNGAFSTVQSMNVSGTNAQDTVAKAHDVFKTSTQHAFAYLHCWQVLKTTPKFKALSEPSKRIRSEEAMDSDINSRPIGI
ncbi:hypothetical protein BSKO_04397 [Bryopsis sp. KO-2023]|nr:hypothetical protein BSKO_04397 [Bryopsis sp. KO-2023]